MGGYVKDGISSEAAGRVFDALAALSWGGSKPYVALCDWNCTPQQLANSGFLERIKGTIIHPRQSTCGRTVDFAVVADGLLPDVVHGRAGCSVNHSTPFDPHSSIRLAIDRSPDGFRKWKLVSPTPLPPLPALTDLEASRVWGQVAAESAFPPRDEGSEHPMLAHLSPELVQLSRSLADRLEQWASQWARFA